MRYFFLLFLIILVSPTTTSGLVTKRPSTPTIFYQDDTTMQLVFEAEGKYNINYYDHVTLWLASREVGTARYNMDNFLINTWWESTLWENNVEIIFDLTDYYNFTNYDPSSNFVWQDEDNKLLYKAAIKLTFHSCLNTCILTTQVETATVNILDIRIYEGTRPEEKPVESVVSKVTSIPALTYLITIFALFVMTYRYKIKMA